MRTIYLVIAVLIFGSGCQCVKPNVKKSFRTKLESTFEQLEKIDNARMKNSLPLKKAKMDSVLQLLQDDCYEKHVRKYRNELEQLRLSARLYDEAGSRFDSISVRLENRELQIKTSKDSIDSKKGKIRELQKKLDSFSTGKSKAMQYTSDIIKTGSDLAVAQSELLALETSLIEPTLNQAIQRGELRLLESDVLAARQVFLKDLLAAKLKLKIKIR